MKVEVARLIEDMKKKGKKEFMSQDLHVIILKNTTYVATNERVTLYPTSRCDC